MTQPATSKTSEQTPATTSTTASPATRDRLATDDGQISVAESVVQKIAGKACREIAGVHAMGTGGTRAFGAIRERIPGSTGPNVAQGVGVEVGETEAAIDLDIVVEYGVCIAELGRSIQRNVKQAVERMTGLRVVEVNIAVDDVYLPAADDDQDTALPGVMTAPPVHSCSPGPRSSTVSTSTPSPRQSRAARAWPGWTAAGSERSPPTCPAAKSPASWSADGRVTVQIRSRWGVPAPGLAALITAVLAPLTGHRPVDVVIADIDDPPGPPEHSVHPARAGPIRPGLPPI